jgi:hypothetical protein
MSVWGAGYDVTTAPPSGLYNAGTQQVSGKRTPKPSAAAVAAAAAAAAPAAPPRGGGGGGGGGGRAAAAPAAPPRGGGGGGNYPGRSVGLPPIEPYVSSPSAAAAAATAKPLLPLPPLGKAPPREALGLPSRGVHFPSISKTTSGNGQLPINKGNYRGGNSKMSRFGFSSKRGSEHRAAAEGSGVYNGDPPSGGGAAAGGAGGRPLIPRSYGTLNYRDSSYDIEEGGGGAAASGGAGGGGGGSLTVNTLTRHNGSLSNMTNLFGTGPGKGTRRRIHRRRASRIRR